MKTIMYKFALFSVVMIFATAGNLPAQTSSQANNDSDRGLTEFESFQSTINSQERLFKLDSNVGWDFNQHFGVSAGLPVYFVDVPSSTVTTGGTTTTTPGTSHNGLGNFYMDFAFRAPSPRLGYFSVLTLTAPTASTKAGLSTGRANVDWNNRFEHSFSRFTPFFDGGIGNSVPDSMLFSRPFTSLGFITHLEEGASLSLSKRFSVNASAYQIVPEGNQKIYSKLVAKGATGKTGSKNVFQTSATASGNGLTRENGYMAWVDFQPAPVWDFAVGYTRSQTYDLNSFAFNLRVNVGKLLHSRKIA